MFPTFGRPFRLWGRRVWARARRIEEREEGGIECKDHLGPAKFIREMCRVSEGQPQNTARPMHWQVFFPGIEQNPSEERRNEIAKE